MLSNLALTILRTQTSEEKVRELTPRIIFFINMHLFVRIHLLLTTAEMTLLMRRRSHELRRRLRSPIHTT